VAPKFVIQASSLTISHKGPGEVEVFQALQFHSEMSEGKLPYK